jgi:hypothetical protein
MISRLLLTVSAYSPLAILTGIRVTDAFLSWALIGGGVLAGLCLYLNLWHAGSANPADPLRVVEVTDLAGDFPSYLMTYLLPFVVVVHPSPRDLVALGVFGLLLLYVSFQSSTVAVNPWIYVIGLRLYSGRIDRGAGGTDEALLLSRRKPATSPPGSAPSATHPGVPAVLLAQSIYLIKGRM